MKFSYIKIFALLFVAMYTFSCEQEPQDLVTADALEGGVILDIASTSGKFLGVKAGEETNDLAEIAEAELVYNLGIYSGGYDNTVESLTVMKSYNGGAPVEIQTVTLDQLPYQLEIENKDQFLADFGISESDLQIGDVFSFFTRINMKDGRRLLSADSYYNVTISCASDLAGDYTISGTRDDGVTYSFPATVVESSPGNYVLSRSGHWAKGVLATPSGEAPLVFSDICNELFIPQQNLGDYYSNQVYGAEGGGEVAGTYDPSTGNIMIEYIIEFGSGNRVYTEVISPN